MFSNIRDKYEFKKRNSSVQLHFSSLMKRTFPHFNIIRIGFFPLQFCNNSVLLKNQFGMINELSAWRKLNEVK